ncbi:MAG: hypothetical protein IKT42_06800 [Clostridia bacterium]|nr:hypothetical protein [Clostridia bacterium]
MSQQQEQTLKNQFIELTFSKEWKKKLGEKSYSDADLIKYCLSKAWPDAIIYVRKKNSPSDSTILANAEEIKECLFTAITNSAWSVDGFDTWHDNMCSNTDFGMRYGVWQKFINMSFKYIYCINDKLDNPIALDFKECHIPLDDNTLLWCRNKEITDITAWNNVNQNQYILIREGVRNVIENNSTVDSALQLEFLVWRIKKVCDVLQHIKNLRDNLAGLETSVSFFKDCGFDLENDSDITALSNQMDILKEYISNK